MILRLISIKLIVLLGLCIPTQGRAASKSDTLRIACIGDSITYGARVGNPATDSYPAQLGKLFGNDPVVVKNFGVRGATILRYGSPNIWQVLDSVKYFAPDIAIIAVGTNETVGAPRHNWKHIGAFEQDYRAYLSELKAVPTAEIFLNSPTDMNLETSGLSNKRLNNLTLRRPRLWDIRQSIKKIAKQEKVHFLDLTSEFENKPHLFTQGDGVHPNVQGYKKLAKVIFEEIHATAQMIMSNQK